jgi:hypothetical protein
LAVRGFPGALAIHIHHIVDRCRDPVIASAAGFGHSATASARRDLGGITGTAILCITGAILVRILESSGALAGFVQHIVHRAILTILTG